ncbi:MAG TPA: GFA family protein [Polyangiaceae bacterium]
MDSRTTYTGRCFCGAVELVAAGVPEGMGFCHCASCRSWGAAPVNAFTLWKPDSVAVIRGDIATYRKTDASHRQFCALCGGHVMTAHPAFELIDVYAAILPALRFAPQLHVHYQEAVMRLRDGLPKFRDLPKEMGGSGDMLPE